VGWNGWVCVCACVCECACVCVCDTLCVSVCGSKIASLPFLTRGIYSVSVVQPRREVYSQADLSKTSGIFCWVSPFSMGKC
jgi:hypothetical protein